MKFRPYIFLIVVSWLFSFSFAIQSQAANNSDDTTQFASAPDEFHMVTTNWAPYYADHLKDFGFFSKIVQSALEDQGYKLKLTFVPWARALHLAETGQAEGLLGLYHTEERAKFLHFSDPIYTDHIYLIARVDLGVEQYTNLRELSKYIIGVGRGWAYSQEFDAADYLKKDVSTDQYSNIRKLFSGRVDLIVMSDLVFGYEAKLHRVVGRQNVKKLQPPLKSSELYIAGSKASIRGAEMINMFNVGLGHIKENGRYEEILKGQKGLH